EESIDRITYHLAASRSCRPTADDSRKFSCRPTSYHDFDLARMRKFSITLLAVNQNTLIHLCVLRAFATVVFIFSERDSRVIKEEFANCFFRKAATVECFYVFGT